MNGNGARWEELVEKGIEAREQMDGAQWELGRLALEVAPTLDRASTYGEHALERYADAIGADPGALGEYRRVAERFPIQIENLSWGHHQAAASLVRWDDENKEWDNKAAVVLLKEAERRRCSVSELRDKVQEVRHRPPAGARAWPKSKYRPWLEKFTDAVEDIAEDEIADRDPGEIVRMILQKCHPERVKWLAQQMAEAHYTLADTDMVFKNDVLGQCLSCGRTVPWGIYTCRDCWCDRESSGFEYSVLVEG